MPLDFPATPTTGDQYTYGDRTWEYNGVAWASVSPGIGPTGPAGTMTLSVSSSSSTAYTLALTDVDKLLMFTSSSAVTVTIPTNASVAFAVGNTINLTQYGTGAVTLAGASGVTVNASPSLTLRGQYSAASAIKVGTDEWVIFGDMA